MKKSCGKKGMSDVVATTLLILAVLIAIMALWLLLLPMFKGIFDDREGGLSINTDQGYSFYDSETKIVSIQVHRDCESDDELVGIRFYVTCGGSSFRFVTCGVPDKCADKTYYLNVSFCGDSLDKISVVPVFSNGKEGKIEGVFEVNDFAGGNVPYYLRGEEVMLVEETLCSKDSDCSSGSCLGGSCATVCKGGVSCVEGDDYCPLGCNYNNDADCLENCIDNNGVCGFGCDDLVDDDCLGSCGNYFIEEGEECDDGNSENGDGCSSICEYESIPSTPCPEGTVLCSDGTCSLNCGVTDGGIICNSDGVCDDGEGCSCEDCYGEQDSCESGLVCSSAGEGCCNENVDGICNVYCNSVDPDCDEICIDNDGICGEGCHFENDNDCENECVDGDGLCISVCDYTNDADCLDNCIDNDGICGEGCDSTNDNDCRPACFGGGAPCVINTMIEAECYGVAELGGSCWGESLWVSEAAVPMGVSYFYYSNEDSGRRGACYKVNRTEERGVRESDETLPKVTDYSKISFDDRDLMSCDIHLACAVINGVDTCEDLPDNVYNGWEQYIGVYSASKSCGYIDCYWTIFCSLGGSSYDMTGSYRPVYDCGKWDTEYFGYDAYNSKTLCVPTDLSYSVSCCSADDKTKLCNGQGTQCAVNTYYSSADSKTIFNNATCCPAGYSICESRTQTSEETIISQKCYDPNKTVCRPVYTDYGYDETGTCVDLDTNSYEYVGVLSECACGSHCGNSGCYYRGACTGLGEGGVILPNDASDELKEKVQNGLAGCSNGKLVYSKNDHALSGCVYESYCKASLYNPSLECCDYYATEEERKPFGVGDTICYKNYWNYTHGNLYQDPVCYNSSTQVCANSEELYSVQTRPNYVSKKDPNYYTSDYYFFTQNYSGPLVSNSDPMADPIGGMYTSPKGCYLYKKVGLQDVYECQCSGNALGSCSGSYNVILPSYASDELKNKVANGEIGCCYGELINLSDELCCGESCGVAKGNPQTQCCCDSDGNGRKENFCEKTTCSSFAETMNVSYKGVEYSLAKSSGSNSYSSTIDIDGETVSLSFSYNYNSYSGVNSTMAEFSIGSYYSNYYVYQNPCGHTTSGVVNLVPINTPNNYADNKVVTITQSPCLD